MKNALKLAFAAAVASNVFAMPAYSADLADVSSCGCAGGSSAALASVDGNVTATGASGIGAAKAGQALSAGSEVFTGNGTAVIALDSGCTVQVGAQSRASIVSNGGAGICVEVSQDVASALPGGSSLFGLQTILPAVLVAGAVAGVVIIANDDDDESVSP